jgi:HEPN domain-containing protein
MRLMSIAELLASQPCACDLTYVISGFHQQAVEKALKAARFMTDADRAHTHDLIELCQDVNGIDVAKVRELVRLCVRSEAMRYPDCHSFPKIPHDVYQERAEAVLRLADEILQWTGKNCLYRL